MPTQTGPAFVIVAGATGDLGGRIARALAGRGAAVRALVRPGSSGTAGLAALPGAEVRAVNFADDGELTRACEGAACVVSALNGLREVVIDQQGRLLDAAVRAGVPRFVPSDFSLDFTRTEPGRNRNLDLRREFMARLDGAPVRATSILNGGFADLLAGGAPMVLRGPRRVIYWGDADGELDFTTKDDVAAYTAVVALDATTPRLLRIAGDVVTPRGLARTMTELTGRPYRPFRVGGVGMLGVMIRLARLLAPQPGAVFPAWQGMQYLRDMASGQGKLRPLDNGRYPDLTWTPVSAVLRQAA